MPKKRKKVLIVVLGLGIAAVAADRAIGYGPAGPKQASAAVTSDAAATTVPETLAGVAASANAVMLVDDSLATRLDNLRIESKLVPHEARDAFCPSQSWLAKLQPEGDQSRQIAATSSDEVRAQEFADSHQLKAVVLVADGGSAIINDEYVRVGQSVEGFQLLSVTKHTAVLGFNTARVTLKLNVDGEN